MVSRKPRGFSLLLAGHIVSTFGSSIYVVTLVLYLAELTDSPQALGIIQFVSYLPAAVLGPVAGAAVDSWSRRRTIVWSDIVRGIVMLATAAVGLTLGRLPYWLLVGATMVVSLAGVAFVPAVHALVPDLVDARRLKRANGLRSALNQIANMGGSALGGALYVALGAPVLILLNGVSFLLSGLSETAIRPRPRRPPTREPLGTRVRVGIDLLIRDHGIRALVLVQAATNLLLPPLVVALPFAISQVWRLPAEFFGYLFAAVLAGGIAGFLIFSGARTTPLVEARLYRGALPLIAAVIATLGFLASAGAAATPVLVPVLLLVMFLAGGAIGTMYMIGVTRIQRSVEAGMRGRVFATLEMLTAVLLPAAYLVSGLVVEALRPRYGALFAALAAATAALAVVVMCHREMRRVLRGDRPADRATTEAR
ncbi:MAG: MFS transporter [Spirochaetota bacterium]